MSGSTLKNSTLNYVKFRFHDLSMYTVGLSSRLRWRRTAPIVEKQLFRICKTPFMDRIESMSVIVTIAEAGSLSAASRQLGMPVPTVSRKLSELETRLKTQLFQRSSRRVSLTNAGRILHRGVQTNYRTSR